MLLWRLRPCHRCDDGRELLQQVWKTPFFAVPFYTKNASFYQDRLGTNIGKALKKEIAINSVDEFSFPLFLLAVGCPEPVLLKSPTFTESHL
jgi:hypothetical protein